MTEHNSPFNRTNYYESEQDDSEQDEFEQADSEHDESYLNKLKEMLHGIFDKIDDLNEQSEYHLNEYTEHQRQYIHHENQYDAVISAIKNLTNVKRKLEDQIQAFQ